LLGVFYNLNRAIKRTNDLILLKKHVTVKNCDFFPPKIHVDLGL